MEGEGGRGGEGSGRGTVTTPALNPSPYKGDKPQQTNIPNVHVVDSTT